MNQTFDQIASNPQPSTVYTTVSDGKIIAWMRVYPSANAEEIASSTTLDFKCRECSARANRLVRAGGPHGALMFAGERFPTAYASINALRDVAERTCQGNEYSIELVTPTTFKKPSHTGPGSQATSQWNHWSVYPAQVTSPELVQRMTQLWSKTEHSVIERLSKFLCDGARDTMVIIDRIIQSGQLARPEYWAATCTWVRGFQQKFPENFDRMSSAMRDELCVYAMATGHAVGEVHYNFQTSANLLDFMVMTSEHAIATEMDKRSDPRTNQVSQLARAKASKGVVAKFGVGLIWNGKVNKDDLDLRIVTRHGTVYFGMKELISNGKVVAKLDFDAGISGTEAEPAENVSFNEEIVGETIQIWIDAYSHRTRGDVPCTIIITQQGLPDKVIDVVWPKDRRSHDYLHVATHIFTPITEPVVAMSETQARAVAAQDTEWNELFGVPTSTVATLDNLVSHGIPLQILPEHKAPELATRNTPESAMSEFANLAVSARQQSKTTGKQFLSQRMKIQPPTTLEELWRRFADKQCLSLSVHLQDFVPGYITQITVASTKALKTGTNTALASCHYEDKFQHPLKPVKTGNARVDESWVPSSYDRTTQVTAIAKIDGKYFFVFKGAQLSPDDVAFPKSTGFYPQDLSNDGHKHRSKWAFLNTSVKPHMPADGSVPAIGAFLTSETATVVVDGQKLVLRV